eukprot:CAMPEP_0177659974 /NCGR_PEP_ID=MMETSP0447-20121125/17749_1 /TAXON_ID=0 /ORGANISM="Stygamoeba regulata, Strain BSH-02190019" /LENGTH=424 /DNA_ID=CAMNT_0019164921 /DNA_START=10 /DNA_END=1284 /DNA_ORIENTATION=+
MASLLRTLGSRCSAGTVVLRSIPAPVIATRAFNMHEYQSKKVMDSFNVRTQRWCLATSPEEAVNAGKKLNAKEYVVKSQVHAGGRGKGVFDNGFKGGVHLTTDVNEIGVLASKMLGHRLVTKQTTADGVMVSKLMIAESVDIVRETYFAILLDRSFGGPVMVASPRGGMDIEAVAEETPDQIFKVAVDVSKGPQEADLAKLADNLGFTGDRKGKAVEQMRNLYQLFIKTDALQVEINPLAEVKNGDVYCVDAKISLDDNAEFRQKEIFAERDTSEDDPREVAAGKVGLNYIGMDGSIGCMVNGAGLAMATCDIIKLSGGSPANFLDVGGGANEDQVRQAFKILTSDSQVKALLVNIFGGIMKCDVIAKGIVNAARDINLSIPLVVRLEGTNVELGKKILKESGLNIIPANNLQEAAEKAVGTLA